MKVILVILVIMYVLVITINLNNPFINPGIAEVKVLYEGNMY